ncbi:uncharacterized protein J4E88_004917 [Alternaria novae-zelandiae]|uniref:uncharacterized protein n=1 Tax=Alternaria novae-zelandiae TaxID=430562 RepID=UPI0020C3920A|nr:uncharacterized protein J4E88_004917 [Alternaria novae-zelandiae]KAI4682030.1 hypothetical protein J4E88_004917 [Alternaria novae-zelandiae]
MSKKGRGRVKRKEVQSEDGWTVITHGLASISLDGKGKKEADAGSLPTRIVEGLTAEKLSDDFRLLQERWEDTLLAKQVKEIVEKKSADGKGDVEEAVCIGIGSFSRDWAHRWRSLWQLVLFVDAVNRLKDEIKDTKIQCFAQDPAFTTLDIEFLSYLSITVLDSDLQAHITSKSFVYSPFVDWYLLLPTFLKSKDPVLYVGNEILDDYSVYAQTKEKKERLEECNEVGKKWIKGREKVALREFEKHGNALNGMVVYMRESDEDAEGEEDTEARPKKAHDKEKTPTEDT